MFRKKRSVYITHRCDLDEKNSHSCLPLLPPQAGYGPKCKRWFKKFFQVSIHHHQTKKYFRSTAMLHQERRRHLRVASWYVIHPFSIMQLGVETCMTILWLFTLFTDIFRIAFFTFDVRTYAYIHEHVYIVDLLQACFMVLCFLTGYLDLTTNEVILNRSQISMHYISTYFIFDFIGLTPLGLFIEPTMPFNRSPSITITISLLKCARLVRINTTLVYLRTITIWMKISDAVHKIITMCLILFVLLHWSACMLFLLPRVEIYYHGKWSETAWVVQAGITESSKAWQYLISMHTAMCYFFSAGTSMYTIIDQKDQIMCSLITVIGYGYLMFMLAQILQMVSSTTASESKYEELVHMLNDFSIKKKMPEMLRLRLLLYYENRFQKRYFRESAILATLSEHLRYEILLHSCKHLFEKLTIFQGLSRVVLGTIIACLKQEVYLPNDVIMKADTPADCMYLVGYGTLALYTIDGLEIMHIEDGDHFGETSLLRPDTEKSLNIVAVETSEIFRLDKQDFFHVVNTYDDFAQRIQKAVAQRLEMIGKLQDHLTRLHGKNDIVNDLKQGKILEKSYRRHK